jgi:hypothetical protein
MPKRKQYPLKEYIRAAVTLAERKKLRIAVSYGSKNAIRFDVFMGNETEPRDMWVVHTEHTKRREVWSKENYQKPDHCLNARPGEFLEILGEL